MSVCKGILVHLNNNDRRWYVVRVRSEVSASGVALTHTNDNLRTTHAHSRYTQHENQIAYDLLLNKILTIS